MFIDVQGFGALYGSDETDSLWGLSDLMDGIIKLGRASSQLGVFRLFAHQFGDGFVIVDDHGSNMRQLISIAVVLHQFVLIKAGHFCGTALERGDFSDVVGCYPETVRESDSKNRVVMMGDGLMTITPVTGTALIKTYKLLGQTRGAVIVIPAQFRSELDDELRISEEKEKLFINWIESTSPTISKGREILQISGYTASALRELFLKATKRNSCRPEWIEQTSRFLESTP